jgi:hypothetical protein
MLAVSCFGVSACAHAAKPPSEPVSSSGESADFVVSPKVITVVGQLKLRSRGGGRPRGTVQVPIDNVGRPDVFGIRFIGNFDDLTRQDLVEFLGQQIFTPAKKNGIPVSGVYEMMFR